jgi:CubicO group peptidase (beta-lactamase class C family)
MRAKRAATLLLFCLAALPGGTPSQSPNSIRRPDGSKISVADAEAFAKRTLDEHQVTGAQIAAVDHGRLAWSAAFGLRERAPDLPMDRQTTTWAASITKGVFSTYVMTLVERGEFDLDVPVAKQLSQPLDQYRERAAEIVREPDWPLVTPRILLSHTSGLLNFAVLEPDKKLHLHFKPGTQFRYSGEGVNLVQFVIEQKKQRPLEQLMEAALFEPLLMKRTAMIFRQEFEADVADRFDLHGKFRAKTRRFPARGAGSMTPPPKIWRVLLRLCSRAESWPRPLAGPCSARFSRFAPCTSSPSKPTNLRAGKPAGWASPTGSGGGS